jgi:hypothetical protein
LVDSCSQPKRLRLGCEVNSETLTRDADSRLVRVVYQIVGKSQEESEDLKKWSKSDQKTGKLGEALEIPSLNSS